MPRVRHIGYLPRAGYELLRSSGELRRPLCVRSVEVSGVAFPQLAKDAPFPPEVLQLLHALAGGKVRFLLPFLCVN